MKKINKKINQEMKKANNEINPCIKKLITFKYGTQLIDR